MAQKFYRNMQSRQEKSLGQIGSEIKEFYRSQTINAILNNKRVELLRKHELESLISSTQTDTLEFILDALGGCVNKFSSGEGGIDYLAAERILGHLKQILLILQQTLTASAYVSPQLILRVAKQVLFFLHFKSTPKNICWCSLHILGELIRATASISDDSVMDAFVNLFQYGLGRLLLEKIHKLEEMQSILEYLTLVISILSKAILNPRFRVWNPRDIPALLETERVLQLWSRQTYSAQVADLLAELQRQLVQFQTATGGDRNSLVVAEN